MPDLNARIEDHVRGNDLDVIRTVSGLPTGQTVSDAWLRFDMITPAGTQLFQKHITTSLVAGEGQVEDAGSGDGVAVLRFEVTNVNSLLFDTGGTPAAPKEHPYGVQVKTSGSKIYEFEKGVIEVVDQIVVST